MRLSTSTCARIRPPIHAARYDRAQDAGVVHLGAGAFHKAHQAVYFDRLLESGEQGWMIQGASLRSARAAEELNPQDGLFVVCEQSGEERGLRLVRSIRSVMVAPADPAGLLRTLAHPATKLVTLTITEKGYCLDPATGALNWTDASIGHDLAHPRAPVSAPGFLLEALAMRHAAGLRAFTTLSCDNLTGNGRKLRAALIALARERDGDLADWIEGEAAFPCSMVDRIVPATTAAGLAGIERTLGLQDEAFVNTERFTQWVVEDRFSSLRPPLDRVGVQFTQDVEAWESAKLRLLNAAHSALAYLGGLAGFDCVHQAVAEPRLAHFVSRLWDEAGATLRPVPGLNVETYRADLMSRFANGALNHRLQQIAMDGSQKIPQRFLATYRDRLRMGLRSPAIVLSLAAFVLWQTGRNELGVEHAITDPLSDEIAAIVRANRERPAALAQAMVQFEPVFGSLSRTDPNLAIETAEAVIMLLARGSMETVQHYFR